MQRHLEDIVRLVQGVQWLYNFPVTQIFTRDILSQMPSSWKEALKDIPLDDLNGIPVFQSQKHWPACLQNFLNECSRLSLHKLAENEQLQMPEATPFTLELPKKFSKGMSPKKKHEIEGLVKLVRKVSESTGSQHILDIGSGKGYIDTCLHQVLDLTVLCADSQEKLVKEARQRQNSLAGECGRVRHLTWDLADDQGTYSRAMALVEQLVQVEVACSCQNRETMCLSKHLAIPQVNNDTTRGVDGVENRKCIEKDVQPSNQDNDKSELSPETWPPILEIERENIFKLDGEEVRCVAVSPNKCILLGLHSCADLSSIMMKIFTKCPQISALVLVSCCYHKMKIDKATENVKEQKDVIPSAKNTKPLSRMEKIQIQYMSEDATVTPEDKFINFPMSQALSNILKKADLHMTIFGLRLAAQESGQRWVKQTAETHHCHMKNVAYRGVLEAFCEEDGLILKKLHRHCSPGRYGFENLDDYVESVILNCKFEKNTEFEVVANSEATVKNSVVPDSCSVDQERSQTCGTLSKEYMTSAIRRCHDKYKDLFPLIEPVTGLQLALQPVLEALVVVDRLVYLRECGFSSVYLEKVFNVQLSPRNVALIAVR